MSQQVRNNLVFDYVKQNPGLTTKEIATYFNVKLRLIKTKWSEEHGKDFSESWKGIYNIKGINGHFGRQLLRETGDHRAASSNETDNEYIHYVDQNSNYELLNTELLNDDRLNTELLNDDRLNTEMEVQNPKNEDFKTIIVTMRESCENLNKIAEELNLLIVNYKSLQEYAEGCEKSIHKYRSEHYTNWKKSIYYVTFIWMLISVIAIMGIKLMLMQVQTLHLNLLNSGYSEVALIC